MKKTLILFMPLVLVMLLLNGCTTPQKPKKTQLQIREFQTRSYDTQDFKMVMKAVMNTLQDDYYIVKQADVDLGLLTAEKEVDVANTGEVFLKKTGAFLGNLLGTLFGSDSKSEARYKKNSIIWASANISTFGDQTRVRINFQAKTLNNKGEVMQVQQIEDEKFYQDFFSKVDKSIFLAEEKV